LAATIRQNASTGRNIKPERRFLASSEARNPPILYFFEEDVFCDLAYKRSSELGLPMIWCQRLISQLLQFGLAQARTLEDWSLDTSTFDAKKSYIWGLAVTLKI